MQQQADYTPASTDSVTTGEEATERYAHYVLVTGDSKPVPHERLKKAALITKWQKRKNAATNAQVKRHLAKKGLVGLIPARLGMYAIDVDLPPAEAGECVQYIIDRLGMPAFSVSTLTPGHQHLLYYGDLGIDATTGERRQKYDFLYNGKHCGEVIHENQYIIMYRLDKWRTFLELQELAEPTPAKANVLDVLPPASKSPAAAPKRAKATGQQGGGSKLTKPMRKEAIKAGIANDSAELEAVRQKYRELGFVTKYSEHELIRQSTTAWQYGQQIHQERAETEARFAHLFTGKPKVAEVAETDFDKAVDAYLEEHHEAHEQAELEHYEARQEERIDALASLPMAEPAAQDEPAADERAETKPLLKHHTPAHYAGMLLHEQHIGDRLKFDHQAGWLRWNGLRWQPDTTFATMYEVANFCAETARRNHHKKTDTYWNRFTRDVLERLKWHLCLEPNSLDTDRHLLGTPVGTVDLRTGDLIVAPKPEWLITKSTTVAPDFYRQPTRFMRFLREIAPTEDTEAWIEYIQRYLGYCLTGEIGDHRCQFWYGAGTNGKSVLYELVAEILGDGYYSKMETKAMEVRRGEAHSTELTVTEGRRFVVVSEVADRHLNLGRFKDLTGDKTIAGRAMRQDSRTWPRTSKLLLIGNHEPKLGSVNEAIRRRIRQVPFVQCFKGRLDKSLEDDLRAESAQILAWLIEGAKMYYKAGKSLGEDPACVVAATEAYLSSQDLLRQWCEDCIDAQPTGNVTNGELKASFDQWCTDNGATAAWTPKDAYRVVGEVFGANYGQYKRDGKKVRGFKGLVANNTDETK